MLSVKIDNAGKKFGSEWIFRNLNHEIKPGDKLVILGGNGSGKSTLLQMISGYVTPNEGKISYTDAVNRTDIVVEQVYKKISFASPYLQLTDDFTVLESIEHVKMFKPFINNMNPMKVLEITELSAAKNKFIRQLSSGMKQRLKLGLAFLCDTPLLLLDEPASNLDSAAIEWYKNMVKEYSARRTVIVCSNNVDHEYFFCHSHIHVTDYKMSSGR